MAKKNKNRQNTQQPLSPERFMREKVRGLEVGTCYVSDDIWKEGIGVVVVTRLHKGGKRTVGFFLIDVFCLGVKDAGYRVRMDDSECDSFMERFDEMQMREASYEEAHNIVYGALSFAEEAGIGPCKDFALAKYVLEEDTDDIPLIEYQFGKDGMHYLFANSQLEASRYLPLMSKNLGDGNYRYVISAGFASDIPQKYDREANRRNVENWKQVYLRTPPEGSPVPLSVRNQRVLDILSQDEHYVLTEAEVDELLAVPHDELRLDLLNILAHALGVWWENPDEYEYLFFPAVGHALMLLTEVGQEEDLDAVLEVLRMPEEFLDSVFGDVPELIIMPVVFRLGQNRLDQLMDFMKEEDLENRYKFNVSDAVLHVGLDLGRRDEAIAWYCRLLTDILDDYDVAFYTDATLNGTLVGNLMQLDAREALPLIKRLYDCRFVDLDVNGVYADVVADMGSSPDAPIDLDVRYRYQQMRNMM